MYVKLSSLTSLRFSLERLTHKLWRTRIMRVWTGLLRRAYLLALTGLLAWLPAGSAVAQNTGGDSSTDSARGQRWAVLVGVNRYAQLDKLTYCVADATKLRDQLVAAGFPREQVFLLVDGAGEAADLPFRENIQRRIESVLKVARPDDLVLVVFSGHGVHLDGKSYFCPTDANLESPETTMVPLDFIYRQLDGSQARQKLLVVDACRNDPRPAGSRDATTHKKSLEGLGEQLKAVPAGITALSSSAAGQISWEDEQLGHGVFAYHVMEGLAGKADEAGNKDGVVSLLELYDYAYLQTTRWVLRNRPGYIQTPELHGKITGNMELAHRGVVIDRPSMKPPTGMPPLAVAPFDATAAKGHQQAWSGYLGQPVEVTNSIGMKLALIPAGEFMMGSPREEVAELIEKYSFVKALVEAEQPQHRVRITKAHYLGVTEVTQAQYERVMGTNPSNFKGAQLPVEQVSWEEAVEFCRKLSAQEGRTYRLPTEAEWEYACRAGSTTKWCFGDKESALGEYAWYGDNTDLKTHPVGEKKPNAWGLCDMHGNVLEWCSDWYGAYTEAAVSDPTGATAGSSRVLRGGGWVRDPRGCRSASRISDTPGYRLVSLGFRVASSSVDASSE